MDLFLWKANLIRLPFFWSLNHGSEYFNADERVEVPAVNPASSALFP